MAMDTFAFLKVRDEVETDQVDTNEDLVIERGYVEWGDGPRISRVATAAELDQLLDRIDCEARTEKRPVLALVGLGSTRYVTVGLGSDEVGLTFNDSSDWTSWSSLGDLYEDADEVSFWMGNQPTYFRRREMVPVASARQAVRMIYESGELPDVVRWYQP